jgi:hypothetical protein
VSKFVRVPWREKRPPLARAQTLGVRRASLPVFIDYPEGIERPKTRAECAGGSRPCPFVSCRHHLFLDVSEKGGLKLNFPSLEPDELIASCSLDVADRGVAALEDAGALMNLTRERVRQIEVVALRKLERKRVLHELAE